MKKENNIQTKESNVHTNKQNICKMKRSRTTPEALKQRLLNPKKPLSKKNKQDRAEVSGLPLITTGQRRSSSEDAECLTTRSEVKKIAQKDNLKKEASEVYRENKGIYLYNFKVRIK